MLREIWILFATCLKFFLEMGCFLNRQRLFVGKTSWKFYLSKVVLKKWGYRNGCPPIIYLFWHLTFAQFTTKHLASFHWLENFSKAPLVNKLEPKNWVNKFLRTNGLLTMVSFDLLHLQRHFESRLFGKKNSLCANTLVTVFLRRVCTKHYCPLLPRCLCETSCS